MTAPDKTKILVDTSIFIEFFRGRGPKGFDEILIENRILLSQYVYLELIQGVRSNEIKTLSHVLGGLETVPLQPNLFKKAEQMLFWLKSSGFTLGIIDLLLAVEANAMRCPIWSGDKIFQKLYLEELILKPYS